MNSQNTHYALLYIKSTGPFIYLILGNHYSQIKRNSENILPFLDCKSPIFLLNTFISLLGKFSLPWLAEEDSSGRGAFGILHTMQKETEVFLDSYVGMFLPLETFPPCEAETHILNCESPPSLYFPPPLNRRASFHSLVAQQQLELIYYLLHHQRFTDTWH